MELSPPPNCTQVHGNDRLKGARYMHNTAGARSHIQNTAHQVLSFQPSLTSPSSTSSSHTLDTHDTAAQILKPPSLCCDLHFTHPRHTHNTARQVLSFQPSLTKLPSTHSNSITLIGVASFSSILHWL